MELLLVFLSTAVGTIAGVAVAIMMQRKGHGSQVGADSILRTRLQNTEWALASAGRDVEDLRRQVAGHEESARQIRLELENAQGQLTAAAAETGKEGARRAEAEQLVADRAAKLEALEERIRQLDAAAPAAEESHRQAEALARQLDDTRKQVVALEAEIEDLRQHCAAVEVNATSERDRADRLVAGTEQDRADYEARLSATREELDRMAAELAAMRQAKAGAEVTLQDERRETAEAVRLLLLAQSKLSDVGHREEHFSDSENGVNGLAKLATL